ncbi:MAG: membrane protein insertase YidC, partial [Caulobacterales bacterium]
MLNKPGQGPGETRNLIIALALGAVIIFGWDHFLAKPQRDARMQEAAVAEQQQQERPAVVSREQALESSAGARVPIDTPSVDGTILLTGGRFDDLNLRRYRQTIDPDSAEVTLLEPTDTAHAQDAFFGWEERDARYAGVGASDTWTLAEGTRLTPQTPIVLTLTTGDGLEVRRTISVDENFMFTVADAVRNVSDAPREVRPFGAVRREGLPPTFRGQQIVHQGMVGVFGPEPRLHEERYENAEKHARDKTRGKAGEDERILELSGPGGWLGLGDHYWLTAMIPAQEENISAYYDASPDGDQSLFRAAYRGDWRTIQPGQEVTYTQRLFAGAKRVDLLRQYQRDLSIPDFDKAVDWGFLFFFTRPFFAMLDFFGKFAGNFGLGILMATVVIKVFLFPIVYQSNMAMAKLRKVQPKMKEIQER